MNVHERIESLADLAGAGGLNADERRELDEHVAACAACAGVLKDAASFGHWVRGSIAPDAPPVDLEDRVIARFRAATGSKKRRLPVGKGVLKTTGWVAAAVCLVVLGNVFTDGSALALRDVQDLTYGMASYDRPEEIKLQQDGIETRKDHQLFFGQVTTSNKEVEKLAKRQSVLASGGKRDEGQGLDWLSDKSRELAKKDDAAGENQRRLSEDRGGVYAVAASGGRAKPAVEVPQDTRKIIRNADVQLEVESYDATSTKLSELVAAEKGQIASASTQKLANGKMQATVVLRVPPERFEAVIAKFRELGTVRHQNIGSEDVTKAYVDLESRLKSKETLAERLRKLLAEGKGTVKELMEVEVQMGNTLEAIEKIKGEIKYYDNLVGLSTITLRISEKDLGLPFEYVQTLSANLALTARDPDEAYAKAQKEIVDAGGQVVDSKMTRQSDGASTGVIRGRVDADKFPALREALKKLGVPTNDTVDQQKSARGGTGAGPRVDTPVRKEQAQIDLSISSPPLFVTRKSQLHVETPSVEAAYAASRKAIEAAGGKILDGSLNGQSDGMRATLQAQIDADKFPALVESLKTGGKVLQAVASQVLPSASTDGGPQLLRERADIVLTLTTPPALIGEEHGLGRTIRETFAKSWGGLLWSIEKLFVGISLAGPWVALLAIAVFVWRRLRRKNASPAK